MVCELFPHIPRKSFVNLTWEKHHFIFMMMEIRFIFSCWKLKGSSRVSVEFFLWMRNNELEPWLSSNASKLRIILKWLKVFQLESKKGSDAWQVYQASFSNYLFQTQPTSHLLNKCSNIWTAKSSFLIQRNSFIIFSLFCCQFVNLKFRSLWAPRMLLFKESKPYFYGLPAEWIRISIANEYAKHKHAEHYMWFIRSIEQSIAK